MRLMLPQMVAGAVSGPVPSVEIVGVVRQVEAGAAETEPMAARLRAAAAERRGGGRPLSSGQSGGDAAMLAGPVRAAVARVNRQVAVARMRTLATIADDAGVTSAVSRPAGRSLRLHLR